MKPVKKNKLIFILPFLIAVFFACGVKKVDEEMLSKVYVENLIADESLRDNPDSLKIRRTEIFTSHGITSEEFENSINEIKKDPGKWDLFFTKARKYLDELKVNKTIE